MFKLLFDDRLEIYDLESYLATYNSRQTAFVLNIEIKISTCLALKRRESMIIMKGIVDADKHSADVNSLSVKAN